MLRAVAVVLLVSSDPDLREEWRKGLVDGGHEVWLATTAPAGVELLQSGAVDILVLDHEVVGGFAPVLSVMPLLTEAPPLILLAGDVDAPAVSARVGAAAFVPKPCSGAELALIVTHQSRTPVPMDEVPTTPIDKR